MMCQCVSCMHHMMLSTWYHTGVKREPEAGKGVSGSPLELRRGSWQSWQSSRQSRPACSTVRAWFLRPREYVPSTLANQASLPHCSDPYPPHSFFVHFFCPAVLSFGYVLPRSSPYTSVAVLHTSYPLRVSSDHVRSPSLSLSARYRISPTSSLTLQPACNLGS